MNFSWYLGFGWKTILLILALGIAIRKVKEGWEYWLLYTLLALIGAYALTRFRLYKREPWRRIHHRSFEIISEFVKSNANNTDGKRDPKLLAKMLAEALLGEHEDAVLNSGILTDTGRKEYYQKLVEDFPIVFTQNIPPEKQAEAKCNILKDIEASEFGPDIVIAAVAEKQYGRLEAARYLLALASGYIK